MWLQFKGWVAENWPWLGFVVLSFTGATVGHFKAFEKSSVEWPFRRHFWDFTRRAFYAAFIGMVMYIVCPYLSIPAPLAFVATGIMSVFGSETIDWMYKVVKERFEQRGGQGDGAGTNKG